ncbi:MAG TPA: amidase [Bdellovibrionales bacterium]|nr:amidase [Bdellovibrionales bacterium]
MTRTNKSRRRFLRHVPALGFFGASLPAAWARAQAKAAALLDARTIGAALEAVGVKASKEESAALARPADWSLKQYFARRETRIHETTSPATSFAPWPAARESADVRFKPSVQAVPARPADLESVAYWPVCKLAALVRSRRVSSVELTGMYLARLRRYNPELNCVVTFLDETAMQEAKKADEEIAKGKYRGPLHGIPWGAKDLIAAKGAPTTWGHEAFKSRSLEYDATVVELLREAGAVLIAKLTTGALGKGDLWFGGQTRNPWNTADGANGSSAGPASAVGAGCVPFALGTETGGSLIAPAARCGVTGLRPTFGRISRYGVMPLAWTLDRVGVMARTAEDTALVARALSKPDARDLSADGRPFGWDHTYRLTKLKLGVLTASFDALAEDAAKKNAENTLSILAKLGAKDPRPIQVPETNTDIEWLGAETLAFFDQVARGDSRFEVPGYMKAWWLIPAAEYVRAQRLRAEQLQELNRALAGVDVYVVASDFTAARKAPESDAAKSARAAAAAHFHLANLAGLPCVTVPNGLNADGQPTNITFYARPFEEWKLLTVAKAFQDATDYASSRPPKFT